MGGSLKNGGNRPTYHQYSGRIQPVMLNQVITFLRCNAKDPKSCFEDTSFSGKPVRWLVKKAMMLTPPSIGYDCVDKGNSAR